MARLNSDARAPNVLMSIDGFDDGYQFLFRKTNGGFTSRPIPNPRLDPPRGALPAWIGLERQGTLFIGSYSTDGATFTEYARQDIPNLGVPDLQVGFAATSGDALTPSNYCAQLSGFGSSTPTPAKPVGLVAVPGDASVSLDWSNNAEADLQGYNLYRSDAGGAFTKVNTALIAASNYSDAGRTNGTQYCYRVRAVNPAGESPDSDQACATPLSGGAPVFRRGDADGNGNLELTDAIYVLDNQFLGGPNPSCMDAADIDDNGAYDLTDAIFSLNFQFLGGSIPPPPGPGPACGPDPSNDTFPACTYTGC
jgi:hypothetical protein